MYEQSELLERIGRPLAVLASRCAQERYMVGATRGAYLLMDEAVEDGLCVVDLLEQMDTRTKALVLDFLVVLRGEVSSLLALPPLPWDEGVLDHPSLAVTREAARHCLARIGIRPGRGRGKSFEPICSAGLLLARV